MQATVKKINDLYFLEIQTQSNDVVVINWKEYRNFTNWQIGEEPKDIHILRKISVIDKYWELTPEQFSNKRAILYKEDFYDLDEEYAFKKFLEENKPVYKEEIKKIDFEIVIIEYSGRVDNPMIIPYRLLWEKKEWLLYKYVCRPDLIAKQVWSEFWLTQVEHDTKESEWNKTWSVPSHSIKDLQFTKVMWMYTQYEKLPKFYWIDTGTYEECSKRYNEHYEAIKEMFNYNIQKHQALWKEIDKQYILIKLEHIENAVKWIENKRNDTSKSHSLQIIRELQKLLTK